MTREQAIRTLMDMMRELKAEGAQWSGWEWEHVRYMSGRLYRYCNKRMKERADGTD